MTLIECSSLNQGFSFSLYSPIPCTYRRPKIETDALKQALKAQNLIRKLKIRKRVSHAIVSRII
jgi:hypothetical protein